MWIPKFLKLIFVFPLPFLFMMINHLKERFSKHTTILSFLYLLIPKMCMKSPILEPDLSLYSDFLNIDSLPLELKLWKRKCIASTDIDCPNGAVESVNCCNHELSSNINFFLLKVLVTLPVTNRNSRTNFFGIKTC